MIPGLVGYPRISVSPLEAAVLVQPGRVCWFRSDSNINADESNLISQWGDKTGGAISVAQSTTGLKPTLVPSGGANGLPYIRAGVATKNVLSFKTSQITTLGLTAAEAYAICDYTEAPTASNGNGCLWFFGNTAGDTAGAAYPFLAAGNAFESFFATTRPSFVASGIYGTIACINPHSAANDFGVRRNGALLYSATANTFSVNSANIQLLAGTDASYYFNGKFYEFILFSSLRDSGQRAEIQAYLSSRYSVTFA